MFFLAAPSAIAYDFGAAGYIAAIGATAIGVAAFAGAAPALATLAIGSAIMGITFDKTETTGSPLVVQVSPGAQLQTPDGWTPPASGQSKPTPPATASSSICYKGANNVCHSDAMAAANSKLQLLRTQNECSSASTLEFCPTVITGTSESEFQWNATTNSPNYANFSDQKIEQCATGYTSAGSGICNLTSPNDVMKPSDGACGITRVGNSFSTDLQDPDCSNIPATAAVTPNSITQTKLDGSQKSVTINPDGSVTATDSRPDPATNTTQTNTTQIAVPNSSGIAAVSGQGTGATNGTGSSNTGTPVPTFDKSGLATEGTLAGIKSDTGAIKDSLTNSGNVDGSLTAEKSALDAAMDGVAGLFTSEPSKSSGIDNDFSISGILPAQCGCTPLTMTFHGKTASFDWCTPMATMKNALAWVIGLFTAFYLISLFRVGGGK